MRREAASQPGAIATVHANLAAVEERLGRERAALAAKTQSERLAQRERLAGESSRRHSVEWVDPAAFRQTPAAVGLGAPTAMTPGAAAAPPFVVGYDMAPQEESSPWRGFVARAKQMTGWTSPSPNQPTAPPAVASQTRVYR